MKLMRTFVILAGFMTAATAHSTLFLINSPATYLFANGETPYNAYGIDLNANGYFAGQTVQLFRAGSYNTLGGPTPAQYGLSAVFSSSNVILPSTTLNRIPGAISAGPTWVSPNTAVGNLPTDIPEDFRVDNLSGTANGIVVTIPAGAQYIFASAIDNFFSNNNNTPEFYLYMGPVPEPPIHAAMGLGVLAVLIRRRRRI